MNPSLRSALKSGARLRVQKGPQAVAREQGQRAPAVAIPLKDKLNKTERRYADILQARWDRGEIQEYLTQEITLKIGEDCRYTPDFCVIELGGTITFIEIKGGFVREDAIVKFRAAAKQFWWARFEMIQYTKTGWQQIR
jgi:hypothetical protein